MDNVPFLAIAEKLSTKGVLVSKYHFWKNDTHSEKNQVKDHCNYTEDMASIWLEISGETWRICLRIF